MSKKVIGNLLSFIMTIIYIIILIELAQLDWSLLTKIFVALLISFDWSLFREYWIKI